MNRILTDLYSFGEKITLPKQALVGLISTSVLSTIHLLLGILIAIINLAILVPLVVKTYKKKDKG